MTLSTDKLSIYIHWPFCKSLCPYCDFNSHISQNIDYNSWLEAYKTELNYFVSNIKNKKITSIFFGGGTPSLMHPKIIEGIIDHIASIADVSNSEITLEANPTSSEGQKFKDFKNAGINRLSIGVQSLLDDDLKILGREHNSKEALKAIELAAENFENYSFDLIYARPNQKLSEWENELNKALSLGSKHISLYQLTIEKGTPFFKAHKDGILKIPSQDLASDFFDLTHDILDNQDFKRYEISNYSKKDYECKHNLCYWYYDDFIGIGPGAHSRINSEEIMMHHMPNKWLKSVQETTHGIQKRKKLDKITITEEMIMMNLRIKEGINIQNFENKTKQKINEVLDIEKIYEFHNNGFINHDKNYIALTSKGMNIHSYITSRLLKL